MIYNIIIIIAVERAIYRIVITFRLEMKEFQLSAQDQKALQKYLLNPFK